MYKIECAGPFKEGRATTVLGSLNHLQNHRDSPDLVLHGCDGVTLPTHRCLLTLQSTFVAEILASLPCCQAASISLPFSGTVLKNLLAVLTSGVSLSLGREDLLNVQNAADLLKIKLANLRVEESNKVVTLKVDGDSTIQDLYHQVTGLPKALSSPMKKLLPFENGHLSMAYSPILYPDQNDNGYDDIAAEEEEEEVVEITPDLIGGEDGFAPHFLMEAQYGENSTDTFSSGNGWMEDGMPEDGTKMPELLEFGDGEEKRYKCSFCPNKEFKKRPEVIRHFKKHIPLSHRKKFQCNRCREKFISNSNLKTHSKVCAGVVKLWECKRCKATFDNKTDYEDHLAEVHNTGRKHECSICHKQLRRAGDVRKHMLTHSEGKPYGCDICGKKFRTESYVKIHRQAHFANGHIPAVNVNMETNAAAKDEIMIDEDEIRINEGEIRINGDAIHEAPSPDEEDTEGTEEEVDQEQHHFMTTESTEGASTPESHGGGSTPESTEHGGGSTPESTETEATTDGSEAQEGEAFMTEDPTLAYGHNGILV